MDRNNLSIIMSIISSVNNIKTMIYDLDYKSDFDVNLSSCERRKLYDFFIKYDIWGTPHDRLCDVILIFDDKNIESINRYIHFLMNDEIETIIKKLGVDPGKTYVYHDPLYGLDNRILSALYGWKTARVGEYVVRKSSSRPFDSLSPELRNVAEAYYRQELIRKHEDGLLLFKIFKNDNPQTCSSFLDIKEELKYKYAFCGKLQVDNTSALEKCCPDTLNNINSEFKLFEKELNKTLNSNSKPKTKKRK